MMHKVRLMCRSSKNRFIPSLLVLCLALKFATTDNLLEVMNVDIKGILKKPDQMVDSLKQVVGFDLKEMNRNGHQLGDFFSTEKFPEGSPLRCLSDLREAYILQETSLPEMFDANGKLPSGFFSGNINWMGSFDECINFRTPKNNKAGLDFKGRYCVLKLYVKMLGDLFNSTKYPSQIGICVPSSCNTDEIASILNAQFGDPYSEFRNYITKFDVKCVPDYVVWNAPSIACAVFLATSLFLVVVATIYDNLHTEKPKRLHSLSNEKTGYFADQEESYHLRIEKEKLEVIIDSTDEQTKKYNNVITIKNLRLWHCFSAKRNIETIMRMESDGAEMRSINGIRVLSMLWIIYGHIYGAMLNSMDNLVYLMDMNVGVLYQIVNSTYYAVDTFFLLSGFLLGFFTFKDIRGTTKKNWFGYLLLHRYLRITPTYAVTIFFLTTLFSIMGDGPMWDYTQALGENCSKHWWRNILYINNFFPVEDVCIGVSWYLANDMQFFLFSPIFFYILKRKPKRGILILFGLISLSAITRSYILHTYKLLEGVKIPLDALDKWSLNTDYMNLIYMKPYTRIGPYIVGYTLGYIHYRSHKFLKLSPMVVATGWTMCFIMLYMIVFHVYDIPRSYSTLICFFSTQRTLWAIIVSWIIFACLNGYGGIINSILSWKMWTPLSRLTYCAFLIHPLYLEFYFNTRRSSFHLTNPTMLLHFLGIAIVSFTSSLAMALVFEFPFTKLEKYFTQR